VTLAVLCLAIATAAAVQLVSGFGFALVAAPVLIAVTDPVASVSVLAVLGTAVSGLTLATGRGPREVLWRESAGLLAWAAPGLVVGALLVDRLPADAVRAAVGVLVLGALAQRRLRARSRSRPRRGGGTAGLAAAGLTAGAMSTSTALNGPPLVVYLTAHGTPPRAARDTLALLFVVLGVAAIATLAAAGNLELPAETAALPVAALAGVVLGHRVFDRMSDPAREAAITAMLVVAACTALGAAVV
jgi:uncharacterized membrane protein YfcA